MSDAAWVALLDRFERDLDDATDILEQWTAPAAPLPIELADRARRLLRLQQERIARTRAELDDVRGQLDALRRVPAARPDVPAYLDIDG